MRQFFALRWMRIRQAFRGNSAFAHDWQWSFGNPLTSLLGPGVLAFVVGMAAWITGSGVLDAFLVAATTFVTTWLVAFVVRLFSLTSAVYHLEEEQAGRPEKVDGRQQTRAKLWALHEEGVRIRNEGKRIEAPDEPMWTKSYYSWHAAVLYNASIYSTGLQHLLDPLDKIAPRNQETARANSRTHALNVSVMSEVLDRLYIHLGKN
jgi:membrane protein implicated in regulation of membrane protease activity